MWSALAAVGLADVVRALPDGLDSPLGEDGAGLSAGQRARVALARVVLARRPIVLLDEPSAHLDEETEQVLLDTIAVLARTSLVLVVAHRPAVLAAADRVLELAPAAGPPGVAAHDTEAGRSLSCAATSGGPGGPGGPGRPTTTRSPAGACAPRRCSERCRPRPASR